MAAWNVHELGFKAIAKRTAKEAGLQVLKDLGPPPKDKQIETSLIFCSNFSNTHNLPLRRKQSGKQVQSK